MNDFLSSPLFKYAAAGAAAVVVLKLAWPLLFRAKPDAQHLGVRCLSCGWKGTVGKYMQKCSKCGGTALSRE